MKTLILNVLRRMAASRGYELIVSPRGTGHLVGEISDGEAEFLAGIAGNLEGEGPIIEIGTHLGKSTCILAEHKERDRELITVDNYSWNSLGMSRELFHLFTSRILTIGVRSLNVTQVDMEKDRFYATYDGPVPAMIFLDADHSYEATRDDLAWARRTGCSVICGHDHRPEHPGVIQAVEECGGPSKLVETVFVL
ncbi:class I SAM-dependent methyltransferase [Gemmatimonadota bacterium]